MFKKLVLIAFTVALSTATNSRSYQKPNDQVWTSVVAWFGKNNVPIKAIDKAGGSLYAEASSFDDSAADCGKPAASSAQPVARTAGFSVSVRQAGGGTTVTVTTQFVEMHGSGASRTTVPCVSKGVLENLLLSSIGN